MAYTKRNTNQTNRTTWLWRLLALGVAAAVAACVGSVAYTLSTTDTAYAKNINSKNQQACDACNGKAPTFSDHKGGDISTNETSASSGKYLPDTTGIGGEWSDQTDLPYKKAINGTPDKNGKYEKINGVWTGGNAHSAQAKIGSWTDSDINDFQSVLPFGTIYIDPTKLYDTTIEDEAHPDRTWKNWYRGDPAYPFTKDTTITLSEYAADKFMLFATKSGAKLQIDNGNGEFTKLDPMSGLYYQRQEGSWEERIGYIGDFTPDGKTEVYDKENDGKALITVRYPNVATLSDGSSADLVIKYTKVTIETDLAANVKITFKDADKVEHTINAPLGIIDANQLYVDPGFSVGQDPNNSDHWAFKKAKFGVQIEYEVSVEKDGVTQPGTILWTANDLDIDDRYTGEDYNTDGSKVPYAESMEILDGAKSYAVTPYYDHTTPANPLGFQIDSDNPKSSDSTANGVRFFATRQDGSTYDSGFSALISSSGTKMRWTGSKENHTHMGTVLFDTTVINQIRMSHGTGGGIYLENYDGDNGCKVDRIEGIAAHGLYAEATLTAVPEDGYRVKAIYVDDTGDAEHGYDSSKAGKTKYEITYKTENGVTTRVGVKGPNGSEVAFGDDNKATVDGITFEYNADGTVDVTMKRISNFKHVHADFEADYYFEKIWKVPTGSNATIPDKLELKATPFVFKMTSVEIDGTKYDISEQGTKYTNKGTGEVYTMNSALVLTIDDKQYQLHGNVLQLVGGNDDDKYPIDHTITSGTTKDFTVKNSDTEYVTVINNSTTTGEVIWRVKYPAEGRENDTDNPWPALPIETDPSAHNYTHVERNYWFVTEVSPEGWSMVDYDNDKALAPGVVSAVDSYTKGDESKVPSLWRELSVVYHDATEELIEAQEAKDHAFMSPLSSEVTGVDGTTKYKDWGGKITNYPAIIIKAEKEWKDDFANDFNTRQDILFHLDAVVDGKTIEDYLPPIKIAKGATGANLIGVWGNKKTYNTVDDINIISDTSTLPYKETGGEEITYAPVKEGTPGLVATSTGPSNGKIYYANELPAYDAKGNLITYSIRETSAVKKRDGFGEYEDIIGYTTKFNDKDGSSCAWDKLEDADQKEKIGNTEVPTKYGKATNTLIKEDFTITKVWDDEDTNHTHTLAVDTTTLKAALTVQESKETLTGAAAVLVQPSTAEEYTPASGDDPASGVLEVKQGASNKEVVFTWHDIPKYIGVTAADGSVNVREAIYNVIESQIDGYDAPTYSNGDIAKDKGKVTNSTTPPKGTPKEAYGAKNTPQAADGKSMFTTVTPKTQDGSNNTITKVELLDASGNPATEVTVNGGKYTIDTDGKITFTPDTDFVGDPPAVTVRGTDGNGLTATTTYTPHVVDNEKTVKRTIYYKYNDDDGTEASTTVVQEHTFTGTVDPETGEITYPSGSSHTFAEVTSPTIDGYTVDQPSVASLTVTPESDDTEVTVWYNPKGVTAEPSETWGLPGKTQTGTPAFDMETKKMPDGSDNELTIKLIADDGSETDTVTVPGQGTYTLNNDGTITFTPEDGYVGNPTPVNVKGTDKNGKSATTTYTPHVVDPTETGEATRTIHYTYLTQDGDKVTDDVKQSVTLTRHAKTIHVDPDTKAVVVDEWDDWTPGEFPALDNPDDKVDTKVWTADSSAEKQTVTEPGAVDDVYVVYQKEIYTVKYLDGDHGTSDGKGDQPSENYDSDVTGGNTVTPSKGYKFTGTYTYVIKDKNGNVIGDGSTDDPASLKVTGNIEFTPVYEKLPAYNINYDKNGGSGTMDDNNYSADEETMPHDSNTFTRDGYKFLGFYAYITDPTTGKETLIVDDSGNPILFTGTEDMVQYFDGMPDGTSIRMEAQWEPVNNPPAPAPDPDPDPDPKPTPAPTPSPSKTPVGGKTAPVSATTSKTGDAAPIAPLAVVALAAAAGMGVAQLRRRSAPATANVGRHGNTDSAARTVSSRKAPTMRTSASSGRGKHAKK